VRNAWTEKILELERQGVGYEELKDYISGAANRAFIHEGRVDEGYGWAGQVIGLIRDIPSVQELIERMVAEAEAVRDRLNRLW
jgi:Dioxygenases related to 2-nitropropane dioxygenase